MAQKFLNGIDVSSTTVVNGSNLDSGSTVLDVQGSQGQLFSVTNSLTGDLFSVSDISGIPILNVNSSGIVTIDGALDSFNVTEFIKHEGDTGTSIQFLTGQMILKNSGGKYINLHSNNIIYFDASAYQFYTGDANFAGDVNTSGDVHIDEGSTTAHQTSNKLRFGATAWNNNIGIESYWMVLGCNQNEGFKFEDSVGNMLLQLNGGNSSSGNGIKSATFAGNVTAINSYFDKVYINNLQTLATSANFLYIDPNNSFSSGIYINNQVKIDGGLLGSYNEDLQLRTAGTTRLTLSNSDGSATFTGSVTATSLDINGDADISGSITNASWTGDVIASAYLDADTMHLTGTQTISGTKTFSNASNRFNGHLFYDAYDAAGNHYPHFQDGSSNSGTTVNWRQYYGSNQKTHTWTSDSVGNMLFTYEGGITAVGALTGTSLDINGDADISGALTLGTALADAEIASAATWNAKQDALTSSSTVLDGRYYTETEIINSEQWHTLGTTQGGAPSYPYRYYRVTDDLTFDKNRGYEIMIDADDNGGYAGVYHLFICQHSNTGNMDRVHFTYISGDRDRMEVTLASDEHVWIRSLAKWGYIKIRGLHETEEVTQMPSATAEAALSGSQFVASNDFTWNGDTNTMYNYEPLAIGTTATTAMAGNTTIPTTLPATTSDTLDFFQDNSGVSLHQFNNSLSDVGGNYAATSTGASYGTGLDTRFGSHGINTQGDGVYVDIAGLPQIQAVSIWYKAIGNDNGYIVDFRHDNPNNGRSYLYTLAGTDQYISMGNDTTTANGTGDIWINGVAFTSGTYNFTSGNWYHIVVTTDAVNTLQTWDQGIRIGNRSDGTSNGNAGYFDQVRTFNRRLTSADVALLYAEVETGATADQTAGEILSLIKTVDGASSGLDADTLDGQEGSYYVAANSAITGATKAKITFDSKGLVTAGGNLVSADIPNNAANTSGNAATATNSTQLDGFTLARIDNAEAFHTLTALNADGGQAKRYHIGRLYGCPAHWDGNWQNIEIRATAESYESGHMIWRILGDYGGVNTQAGMMDLYLKEASGPMCNRFNITLGTPVDAGWNHSNQDTYYVDLYADAAYYSQWEINIKTYGHGTQNTNPTSGGATTVIYDSPSSSNISDFNLTHATIKHLDYEIYHEGHLPTLAELGAAADTVVNQSDFVSAASGGTFGGDISVKGNILLTGDATTTNQGRIIDFTGFDKEGVTDFSDRAYISHTTNTGGHTGSVLVISSQNDANDGIAFATSASSNLKHNNNIIWTAGNDGPTSGLAAETAATAATCTGNAATVTTNANLTGHITSNGNAAVLGSFTTAQLSASLSDSAITTNPTINTIPLRTANGDIAAREIILSSSLSGQIPTVLVSMYPSTNQLVRTTPAAVAASLPGAFNSSSVTSATTTTTVVNVAHASYTAAFFDFVIKNGTNVRAGTVYACHNGASTPLVEFTETSTVDLGDTSDVTLSVDISGTNMRLRATTTSSTWTIKSLTRLI